MTPRNFHQTNAPLIIQNLNDNDLNLSSANGFDNIQQQYSNTLFPSIGKRNGHVQEEKKR